MNIRQQDTSGLTGYAKVIQTVLTTSGPVALIAIALTGLLMYLVLTQMGKLGEAVAVNHSEIVQAKIDMGKYVARQEALDKISESQMNLLIRITQQMCLNGAKTDEAIRGCLPEK